MYLGLGLVLLRQHPVHIPVAMRAGRSGLSRPQARNLNATTHEGETSRESVPQRALRRRLDYPKVCWTRMKRMRKFSLQQRMRSGRNRFPYNRKPQKMEALLPKESPGS